MRARLVAFSAGPAASLLFMAAWFLAPEATRAAIHERAVDFLLTLSRRTPLPTPPIVVVEIDSTSLARDGEWPWRRGRIAKLVSAIASAKPKALALDIFYAEPDTHSPAALARALAAETGRADLNTLAASLLDEDEALAAALAEAPTVLGFALDPRGGVEVSGAPMNASAPIVSDLMWRAAGARPPTDVLSAAATGLGALPLSGDADGVVRRAPGLVVVAGALRPGLALETLRVATAASSYELSPAPSGVGVRVGSLALALPSDGAVRLRPDAANRSDIKRISAWRLLESEEAPPEGAVVFLGVTAPEAGGLRASAADPLTPTARLQAAAYAQLREGDLPRAVSPGLTSAAGLLVLLALASALAARLSPTVSAAAGALAFGSVWTAAATAAASGWLVDPILASLAAFSAFAVPGFVNAAGAQRREARVRARFAERLAPSLVDLLAADPNAVRLRGERRIVTTLFSDIEDFSGLVGRTEPEMIVKLLDGYFEGVGDRITEHGGMVDKFVGDGVTAFFGLPVELEGHAERAIRCAFAIAEWTEAYRHRPEAAAARFGRTRVGVETGETVAGDIGSRGRLSYAAVGDSVNLASRLEAANKVLGTQICIGPQAAELGPQGLLRPTGRLPIRGFPNPIETYGAWPEGANDGWRTAYLEAWAHSLSGQTEAAAVFARLAGEVDGDPVCRRLSEELARA